MSRMQNLSSIPTETSPARIVSREDAIRWARSLLSGGEFVVLDSETTGLGNPIDFVEVGVLSSRGEPLFDSLIKPSCPIDPRASRLHGHTVESLTGERRFFEVYPDLLDVVWGKRVVVYKNQKLPGGDHTALGDARATLRLIERMAEGACRTKSLQ